MYDKCFFCVHDGCTGCMMNDCCAHEDNEFTISLAITCIDRFMDRRCPFRKEKEKKEDK